MGLDCRQALALFSGWTCMLVCGALYVYGGIAPYLVSDLYYKGNKDISSSKLSIVLTVSMVTTNLGIFLSSLKALKFSYRIMAFISMVGISGSTYALSYANSLSEYILYYGVLFGLFIGYGYLAGVRNCYDYLPDQKGLCSGVCMMGFGLGPVIFMIIFTQLVNPDNLSYGSNKKYPLSVALNVPQSLRIISMVYLSIGMLGVILLKPMSDHQKSLHHHPPPPPPLQQKLIEMQPINQPKQLKDMTEEQIIQSLKPEVVAELKKKNLFVKLFSKVKGIGKGIGKGITKTFDKTIGSVLKKGLKGLNTSTYDMPEYMGDVEIELPQAPQAHDSLAVKRRYHDKKKQKEIVHQLNQQTITKELFVYLFRILPWIILEDLHMLVAILGLSASFGLFLAFNYKSFGFYQIKDDKYMSLIGICGSLVNGLSRLMWGILLDKYSFRTITTIINCMLLVGCILADYAVQNKLAYLILISVVYGCFGGNYSIYPPQTVKMLGKVLGSRVYFFTYMGFSSGAILQYLCCIFFIQPYGREGYTYCFIILAGLLILAIFYGLTVDFPVYEQIYHHDQVNVEQKPQQKVEELRQSAKQKSLQNIEKIMNK